MRSCVFAVRSAGVPRDELERRVARLAGYYGARREWTALLASAGEGVWSGWVAFDARAHLELSDSWRGRRVVWRGEPPPPGLASGSRLVAAGDLELRRLAGSTAVFATARQGVTVVTGVSAPAALYGCAGAEATAYATHAVAAAWLARGRVSVDADAVPELVALEFVGGRRTLVDGVRRIPAATRVDIGARVAERSFWTARDRWRTHLPHEAQDLAEQALLRTLAERLAPAQDPWLGLTGGLDSLAVAVALRELGVPARTFTWDHAPADAQAARTAAERLALPHVRCPTEWAGPDRWRAFAAAEVRDNEGAGPCTGRARVSWPDPISAFVTGGGGETGRAFYYRLLAANFAGPRPDEILSVWRPAHRLRLAPAAARARVEQRAHEWLLEGGRAGLEGWQLLDFVYAEYRVTDWGRAMSTAPVPTVAAFAHPEVTAALTSLPVAERTADGFHRRLIGRYAPGLLPPALAAAQRRRVPRVARRLATRGRLAGRSLAARGRAQPVDVQTRWLVDQVGQAPVILDALGERWVQDLGAAALRGSQPALAALVRASGPAALESALSALRE